MSVCDVPVIAAVCDAVGEGTASLIAAPFDWLAQAMGAAASWMFESVWRVFDTTTLLDIAAPGYIDVYNVLFGVAVFVTLVFFCLQLITGLVRRDPTALSRACLGLAKSVLGSFLIISVTGLLLEITDQLAIGIVQATGNTMEGIGDRIALLVVGLATISIASPGVGAIITIFLAGLAISAAAIVWFSLLIRKALLLVAIVFGPVALAGSAWDATRGWFTKWAAFVVALILSKLVLVVIFLVAVAQVAAPIDADLASVSDPIAGIVLMFIAAFAPYMTYKFLSFVGFDMYHAMSSEQEAKSALNRPVPIPTASLGGTAKKVLDSPAQGGVRGSSGTPVPAPSAAATAAVGSSGQGVIGAATATGGGATTASAGTAGPVGAAIVAGATVAKGAVTAGPRVGGMVGRNADSHTQSAGAAPGSGAGVTPPVSSGGPASTRDIPAAAGILPDGERRAVK